MSEKYSDDHNIEGTVCSVLVSQAIEYTCCCSHGGHHHEDRIKHYSQRISVHYYAVHVEGEAHLKSSLETLHR